jgi:hypothetical protein
MPKRALRDDNFFFMLMIVFLPAVSCGNGVSEELSPADQAASDEEPERRATILNPNEDMSDVNRYPQAAFVVMLKGYSKIGNDRLGREDKTINQEVTTQHLR